MKRTKLPYATPKRNSRTGRMEWWYRRGKVWKLLPGDPGQDTEASKLYWQYRTGKALAPKAQTMADLVKSYRLSPAFAKLKATSRKQYEAALRYLEEKNAKVRAPKISRANIIATRDQNAHRPAFANMLLAVLSKLMEHAIDLGWRNDNPVRGVEALPGGEGHQPWTEGQKARFRAVATGPARTALELCLGTGQRISDVLRMKWDDLEDWIDPETDEVLTGINVTPAKSDRPGKPPKRLWIPLTPTLESYLATLPRGARTTIITRRDGGPMSYSRLLQLFDEARTAADCAGCTIHGLRYNAVSELYEAGCTDAMVRSISGHETVQMAMKYGIGAQQKVLAAQARRLLNAREERVTASRERGR